MRATVIYAWFVLLSIIACIQKINCGYGDYDYGDTPLQDAVRKNDLDLVKTLLANGNDVKATNYEEETALMIAASYSSAKMIELLIPNSDVKATNNDGNTALMYAARYGNEKSVELLLTNSDVKATNNEGYTALMNAARYGNEKSVELLLPNSDVTAENKRGETALEIAKIYQNNQIVSLLQIYRWSIIFADTDFFQQ